MSAKPFTVCRPPGFGAFQFAIVSSLRAAQLMRGCTPRVEAGSHKATVIAQREIAEGMVVMEPFSTSAARAEAPGNPLLVE